MNYKDEVYKIVQEIPRGKVATYGQVAEIINSKLKITNGKKITPRMVGWTLHINTDPKNIPCHRVVNRDGRVAASFAFGGAKAQKAKLISEGVPFRSKTHVDLVKSLWNENIL